MDPYHQDIAKWRQAMDANLKKENSWLALAGLYWLEEGENSFGSDPSNSFVLPPVPGAEYLGKFISTGGRVSILVREGLDVRIDGEIKKEAILEPDISGTPTKIVFKTLTMMLIDREDGLGIRLWDNRRPERENFQGRCWFPVDEQFLIRGVYQPYKEPSAVLMSRKNGADYQTQAGGQILFSIDGMECSLLAFEQEDGSLFTLFLDRTSGKESYPAGRYLIIDPPRGDAVMIDFNRAYHPPCAFTDFATCPLPPARNRLEVAVHAGEKNPG